MLFAELFINAAELTVLIAKFAKVASGITCNLHHAWPVIRRSESSYNLHWTKWISTEIRVWQQVEFFILADAQIWKLDSSLRNTGHEWRGLALKKNVQTSMRLWDWNRKPQRTLFCLVLSPGEAFRSSQYLLQQWPGTSYFFFRSEAYSLTFPNHTLLIPLNKIWKT